MSAFFFQRINDHIQYLRRLEETLKDQGDFRGTDFHSCKLGQWIDTEGPSQIPEGADRAKLVFEEMIKVHEHFHQTGEQALAAKEANDPAAVRQAITEMLKDSNFLVSKLMELDRVCKT